MIRYITYALPYLLKVRRRKPAKKLLAFMLAYTLIILAMLFLTISAFLWIADAYGADVAFASIGGGMLILGIVMINLLSRPDRTDLTLPLTPVNDPLAKYVPESVRDNPAIQKLLLQISQSPVTATASAVALGMLLSKELFEDTK